MTSTKLVKMQAERSWSALVDSAVIQDAIFPKLPSSSVTKHIRHHSEVFSSTFIICMIESSKR